jgi:hypothetical protein
MSRRRERKCSTTDLLMSQFSKALESNANTVQNSPDARCYKHDGTSGGAVITGMSALRPVREEMGCGAPS